MESDANPPPLSAGGKVVRTAVVVLVAGGLAAAFAFAGGWLTPHKLTPDKIINTFEQVAGRHEGFRRNHAKGVIVGGTFESNGNGAKWSKAGLFAAGVKVPVDGRFSLPGGLPYAADAVATVRAFALRFGLPDGEEWRTAMINLPVFIVNTPAAFEAQLATGIPDPKTGKPDPSKMGEFLKAHPETAAAFQVIKKQPRTSGFLDSQYNALNAFVLTSADGTKTPVRWAVVPVQTPAPAVDNPPSSQPTTMSASQPGADNPNFLFDRLIKDLSAAPQQFRLVLTIGQPGDPTNDATKMWPADREKVDVGTITLDRIQSEDASPVGTLNFDPTVLPDGIAVSDDPLLPARSAAYSNSFTRRSSEPMHTAIPSSEVTK